MILPFGFRHGDEGKIIEGRIILTRRKVLPTTAHTRWPDENAPSNATVTKHAGEGFSDRSRLALKERVG